MSIHNILEDYKKFLKNESEDNLELEFRFKPSNKRLFENAFKTLLNYNFKKETEQNLFKSSYQNIRCELNNLSDIEEFCNNDILPDTTNFIEKTQLNYFKNSDYDFKGTISREEPKYNNSKEIVNLYKNWKDLRKIYRLMNRVSVKNKLFPGIVVDFSIVKEKNIVNKETFKESNLINIEEKYEIEIEIYDFNSENLEDNIKKLIKYILIGIQDSNFPISKKESKKILTEYQSLYNDKLNFIGPSSYTLQKINLVEDNKTNEPCIYKDFCVTDKADGERKLLYISKDGLIYFISTISNEFIVQYTGNKTADESLKETLIDGEYIKKDKENNHIYLFAGFDIYFTKYKDKVTDIRKEHFEEKRYKILNKVIDKINKEMTEKDGYSNGVNFIVKEFYFIENKISMKDNCRILLDKINSNEYPYNTDGLIFSSSVLGVGMENVDDKVKNYKYTWGHSFKWKPPKYNTIDFLVKFVKDENGNKDKTEIIYDKTEKKTKKYKLLNLYVIYNEKRNGLINTQNMLLNKNYTINSDKKTENILFVPETPYDKDAYKCYIEIMNDIDDTSNIYTEENELIENNSVLEFKYVMTENDKRTRWKPLRLRYDKQFGNAYHVANSNWNTIHNPIDENMLTNGNVQLEDIISDKVYYNKDITKNKTKNMREFHNLVKKKLYSKVKKNSFSVIDYAVGKGGDLHKWFSNNFKLVLGIDLSEDNIHNTKDGACARYIQLRKKTKENLNYLFIEGDSSKSILNSEFAQENQISKEVVKHLFGLEQSYQYKSLQGLYSSVMDGFDIGSIQFALHYMFSDVVTINKFLKNCSDTIKVDGHFIGTCFDGIKVFNLLKHNNIKENDIYELQKEDSKIWHVRKKFKEDLFTKENCLGYKISIYQESINQEIDEYLVHFDYLIELCESYGFTLVQNNHLNIKNNFETMYNSIYKDDDFMSKEEKEISFLNNYFIFKKIQKVDTQSVFNTNTTLLFSKKRNILNSSKPVIIPNSSIIIEK